MPIHILTVGSLKEKYFRDAAAEYLKRLTRYDKVSVSEIPDIAEPANASAAQIAQTVASEGERILSLIKGEDYVTALCIQAPQYSSEKFAQKLQYIKDASKRHVFVIGGSNGLSDKVLVRANEQLSQCICSHLAQHGGGTAVGLQGGQKIAGRAAGIGG